MFDMLSTDNAEGEPKFVPSFKFSKQKTNPPAKLSKNFNKKTKNMINAYQQKIKDMIKTQRRSKRQQKTKI